MPKVSGPQFFWRGGQITGIDKIATIFKTAPCLTMTARCGSHANYNTVGRPDPVDPGGFCDAVPVANPGEIRLSQVMQVHAVHAINASDFAFALEFAGAVSKCSLTTTLTNRRRKIRSWQREDPVDFAVALLRSQAGNR